MKILIIFILFMYDILQGLNAGSFYHNLNIFKVYIMRLTYIGLITFVLTLILSTIAFRPFCAFICPFGLWSWLLSHISIMKIRVNHQDCIKCNKCIKVCPNNAMEGIYKNTVIKKDCYVCGECINSCPPKCIDFK